jgi:hypothetical protein
MWLRRSCEPILYMNPEPNTSNLCSTPLISKFHDPHVPLTIISRLTPKKGVSPHLTKVQALSPPFDNLTFPRNYTSWNTDGLSVGGVEFDMASVGGASVNPTQFTPGLLLWRTSPALEDGMVGWLSVSVSPATVN